MTKISSKVHERYGTIGNTRNEPRDGKSVVATEEQRGRYYAMSKERIIRRVCGGDVE
jgi:hypothetical protein